jgi:DeoR/GlpR family transcriptional regulator of sugar metabolism
MNDSDPPAQPAVTNYRHKKILELLYRTGSLSAEELSREFGVSKITIRRDLDALAADKLLERTRGGAVVAANPHLEAMFTEKESQSNREKRLIGKYAATLAREHDTIFLNAGSTTLEVLRHLGGKKVKVVTNNAAATSLSLDPGVELIMLGGEYRPASRSLIGELTLSGIRQVFSSLTILGINGISIKKGFTSAVYQETTVNGAMIENSSAQIVVVADHGKMNAVSSFLTCPLSRIDLVVTDWLSPPAFLDELREAGVKVAVVEDEEYEPGPYARFDCP